jgi:putative addiction module killer protein
MDRPAARSQRPCANPGADHLAEEGHFGDWKAIDRTVSELRVHAGPGYRVYFTRRGNTLVILLAGGDKRSQRRDIEMAKKLVSKLRDLEEPDQ